MSDKRKRRPRDKQPAQSQATQRPVGTNQHSEGVRDKTNDTNTLPRGKETTTYAERRLRKDRPDLYALSQLLRSDRKRTGGWVLMGKPKGVYA
jgi:hypothetical protein